MESLKFKLKKIFLRDMDITRAGFLYFVAAFTLLFVAMDYLIVTFITFNPFNLVSPIGISISISIFLSIFFSGLIVDSFKNRMNLLLVAAAVNIVGIFISLASDPIFAMIGTSVAIFGLIIYLIDLLTIVIHESTILNRGRMIGYLFFISYVLAHLIIFCCFQFPFAIPFIEIGFFGLLIYIAKNYQYIETEERLRSDLRFREVITKNQPIFGYIAAITALGFILGNAFPTEMENLVIDPVPFIILSLIFLVITGTLLDNMGRKWTFTGGILVLSALIIFAGIFQEIYEAVFFGLSIPITFTLLFTFAGDFATERNTIKYRGRICAVFLIFIIGGFVGGIFLRFLLVNILYMNNPALWFWIPNVVNGINSLLLIILLVWIMPLPEILSARESDWAESLRNLYVFNKDSICLYTKSYLSVEDSLDLPSEDLITGGLTGILTLISEITNEKKNLRIIDKERVKIYFSYGRNVIVTLISTKYMPILFKKLELFTKAFEQRFEAQLENFSGKINVFLNNTDDLVARYFK